MNTSRRVSASFTYGMCCFLIAANAFGEDQPSSQDAQQETVNATLVKPAISESKRVKDNKADAIKLESVFVGDKEQPAISYFIPWQGIGTPDKLHWNVEQKHDGALDLVDREIMLRSMHIYEEMNLESPQSLD
ncbi:hypothetical protein NBRC116494_32750 [Aurantivibrio plasticivorans]